MPFRANQARRVEDDIRPARIQLEHRSRLNVHPLLARFAFETIGVLVGDRDRELVEHLGGGGIDWRGVRELGEYHQAHRQERSAPCHRQSIIVRMRSVLARICARSIGLGRSV